MAMRLVVLDRALIQVSIGEVDFAFALEFVEFPLTFINRQLTGSWPWDDHFAKSVALILPQLALVEPAVVPSQATLSVNLAMEPSTIIFSPFELTKLEEKILFMKDFENLNGSIQILPW